MRSSFIIKTAAAWSLIMCVILTGAFVAFNDRPDAFSTVFQPSRGGLTLVLDPGHGGADGGAVSVTGTYESVINLDIAIRTSQLAAFCGINHLMTRESEDIEYPDTAKTIREKKVADQKGRVELINSTDNAILISIHQNKFSTAQPSGCQVFYGVKEPSRELADHMQDLFFQYTDSGNRQAAAPVSSTIYLMNSVNCPSILIECGFVSNPREAALLEDGDYQKRLAVVIIGGLSGFLSRNTGSNMEA